MLCVGSDFTDVSAPTEFALNLRLADNLGAAVLAVVSGRRKSAEDVAASVRYARDTLAAAGVAVVAVVANRVDPGEIDGARAALDATTTPTATCRPPTWCPYDPVLVEPTVGEVAAEVGARVLVGDPAELDRDVRGVVVAAATLPTVLDHLVDGALVLTPGDRSEIVLGVLAAARLAQRPARQRPAADHRPGAGPAGAAGAGRAGAAHPGARRGHRHLHHRPGGRPGAGPPHRPQHPQDRPPRWARWSGTSTSRSWPSGSS